MTSQILAIFYMNDLDHYIKEVLKIRYYVRYQDDFVLMHESKEYLKNCLEKIEKFLKEENLVLNRKTRIYKNTDNFVFLGRTTKGRLAKYRCVNRNIKRKKMLYMNGKCSMNSVVGSIVTYKNMV